MQKYHIHIKAETDEELKEELRETAFILAGLHEAIEEWQTIFGAPAKVKKNLWMAKAKEWIEKHKTYITVKEKEEVKI